MSKKVVAINDLSGLGQSSLCAILPIISAMGNQACPLPTAVLSSQTDGYHNYAFRDLSELWPDYFAHWQKEAPSFDCIYSGFLGSGQQIELIEQFLLSFAKSSTLIVIDPVLGDGGKLYDTMDENMVSLMRRLITHADVITPNYTELCLLCGDEYSATAPLATIKEQMKRLSAYGAKNIIVTSIPTVRQDLVLTAVYECASDTFTHFSNQMLPAHYPGSGDIFAAVLVGSLLNGDDIIHSSQTAASFVYHAIKTSLQSGRPFREGVALEQVLPLLYEFRKD